MNEAEKQELCMVKAQLKELRGKIDRIIIIVNNMLYDFDKLYKQSFKGCPVYAYLEKIDHDGINLSRAELNEKFKEMDDFQERLNKLMMAGDVLEIGNKVYPTDTTNL